MTPILLLILASWRVEERNAADQRDRIHRWIGLKETGMELPPARCSLQKLTDGTCSVFEDEVLW